MKHLLFMPAPRVWGCLCYLLLLTGIAAAQTPDPEPVEATTIDPNGLPLDDFTHREVVAQHTVLKYPPVRECDILWEKRLWRVIDLREKNEWNAGHLPGAELHPLGTVTTTLAALDRATPLAIHCQAGARSAIGASVLERMGFTDVVDLTAGYGGRSTG